MHTLLTVAMTPMWVACTAGAAPWYAIHELRRRLAR